MVENKTYLGPTQKKATEPVIFEPILIHFECLNHSAYIFSEVFRETHLTIWNSILQHTADGRNPAPVDRCSIPEFIGFQPSQVVQDFFHPPYVFIFFYYFVSIATRGTWGSPKNWHRERQKPLRRWRVVPPPCCSCPSLRPRRPRFQPEKTRCLAGKNVMWIMLKGTALQINLYIYMYIYNIIYIRVYLYMDINIV